MDLKCHLCGTPFKREDLDFERQFARCGSCGALADLASPRMKGAATEAPKGAIPSSRRAQVPLPEKWEATRNSQSLKVTWRWFSLLHVFLLIFCIAWNGFLVGWFSIALGGDAPLVFLLFPIVHVAVGIGMAWYVLAGFLNSTHLEVTRGALSVRHGPVPWFGNLNLPVPAIEQVYVTETVHRSKQGKQYSYKVNARLRPKASSTGKAFAREQKLISGLRQVEQALWLEQEIEDFLGIEDESVVGEVRKE